MSPSTIAVSASTVAGGLAFFLYGMKVMSGALQAVAGNRLRDLVYRLTKNRVSGFAIGNVLGFAVHSGAATILLVSFINAGMMTLAQSIPVMLGANVGTTLSMQLISFKIGKYALSAIAVGVVAHLAAPRPGWKHAGAIMFGFGLLFLGMDTMSGAVVPLRESGSLEALLLHTRSGSVGAFALAFLLSLLVTLVFQSSGATIGVVFALCQAGVFTELRQVFPVILGAHIGTCSATILGSFGTNIEARRSAYAHVAFNVLGSVLAVAMLPLYQWVVPLIARDMTRQVANTHTLVQLVNALAFLPFAAVFARFVRSLSPSKEAMPEPSHLEDAHIDLPELAIADALREERRMACITRTMLVQAMSGLLRRTPAPFQSVAKNEEVVDTMKEQINNYLGALARRRLSSRQSVLLQHLMTAASDLERIADHVEDITETTRDKVEARIWFDDESMRQLVDQYTLLDRLLRLTILSLDPELRAFKTLSQRMLEMRREFVLNSRQLRARYRQLLVEHQVSALNGLFYERYLRCFDRIVRHTKSIARVEQHDFFFVKPKKFARRTGPASSEMAEGVPLPVDERMLREEISFADLGIDLDALKQAPPGERNADGALSEPVDGTFSPPSSVSLVARRPS